MLSLESTELSAMPRSVQTIVFVTSYDVSCPVSASVSDDKNEDILCTSWSGSDPEPEWGERRQGSTRTGATRDSPCSEFTFIAVPCHC
jgi:hypothetical protein